MVSTALFKSVKEIFLSSYTSFLITMSESVTSARPIMAVPELLYFAPPFVTSMPLLIQSPMSDERSGVGRRY
jgi:hypothetical protein